MRASTRGLHFSALLLLLLGPAPARGAGLTLAQRQALGRGEIVVHVARVGANAGKSEAIGVVDATPEQVFTVIKDVAHYKELFERIVESRVVARRPGSYDFYYVIDMPWPLSDYRCVTRNIHTVDKAKRRYERRWTLIKGTFHRNDGSWVVHPWKTHQAVVVYSVLVEPKTAVPDFIVRYAAKKALPKALEALRKRVALLKKKGKL